MRNIKKSEVVASILSSLAVLGVFRVFHPSIVEAVIENDDGGGGGGTNVEINIGDTAKGSNVPGTADYVSGDGMAGFAILFGRLLGVVLIIGAILVFLYLIWGGLMWITSGGDKGKVEIARNRITHAVIGLIVLAATIAIYLVVANFLGLDVFTFTFV